MKFLKMFCAGVFLFALTGCGGSGGSMGGAGEPTGGPDLGSLPRLLVKTSTGFYLMNFDGSGQKALTFPVEQNRIPVFSPDARLVAYGEVQYSEGGAGAANIYVENADGSGGRRLIGPGGFGPQWSSDGRQLLYASTGRRIIVVNADGSGLRTLAQSDFTINAPRYSFDNQKIGFSAAYPQNGTGFDTDVWIMNADGSNPVKVISTPRSDTFSSFSPNGSKIIYSSERPSPPYLKDIFIANVDGSNSRLLATNTSGGQWQPDGQRIIFGRLPDGTLPLQLFSVNLDGLDERRLAANLVLNDSQIVSPTVANFLLTMFGTP